MVLRGPLGRPIRESQIVAPSSKIDLERVPSSLSEERPIGAEDFLDQVFIPESPIAYSPEVEVVLTKAILEGGGGDDVLYGKEIVRVVSWVVGVLMDVLKTEVAVVSMEVNEASTIVVDIGASLPFIDAILTLPLVDIGDGVGVSEGGEVPVILADARASLSFIDTISALV